MVYYVSMCHGALRDELEAYGIRFLITREAAKSNRVVPPFALDSGGWSTRDGSPFDEEWYRAALEKWGALSDWIVLPDIFAGGIRSLELSMSWVDRVAAYGRPMLLAVQDGMKPEHVDSRLGVFVGGSFDWKWTHGMSFIARVKKHGQLAHVGRVNSVKRIQCCIRWGADSVDGTCLIKDRKRAPLFIGALRGTQCKLQF